MTHRWWSFLPSAVVLALASGCASSDAVTPIVIHAGGMTFDALAAGSPAGQPVLLLHGFPQSGEAFRPMLAALARNGYYAVAPDQRGYSPGARPAGVAAYGMSELANDVVRIADALGMERFHLVGHDWGGAVAWVVATREPDRVRSLTVLSTPHFLALAVARADTASDQRKRSSYFADLAAPDAAPRLLADSAAGLRAVLGSLPADRRAPYLARLGSVSALDAALNWYRAAAPGRRAAGSRPPVPPVRVPTLYVWGTADGAFGRAAAEATREHVVGPYTFVALDGMGHWLPEMATDTVTALLLRQLARAAPTDRLGSGR